MLRGYARSSQPPDRVNTSVLAHLVARRQQLWLVGRLCHPLMTTCPRLPDWVCLLLRDTKPWILIGRSSDIGGVWYPGRSTGPHVAHR